MKKALLLFSLVLLVFQSCRKDDVSMTTTIEDDPLVENKYVVNVHGQVFDQDNQYLTDAKISYDGIEIFTDEYGLFTLEDVKVGQLRGTFLAVTHEDYHDSGVRIYANTKVDQNVKVIMIKKELDGLVSSGQGGEINFENGGKIIFQPNSFQLDGNPYHGDVNVYVYYLDPSLPDFLLRSPGDLSAVNDDDEITNLRSFGMISVELIGENGEELNIIEGHMAEIHVPVPNDLISEASNEIPLWHFDETLNRWVEEGSATLQGDTYVGNVSHFSWWNCDIPYEYITLCLTLYQQRSTTPLQNTLVNLISQNWGIGTGITDANGTICGFVPVGEVMEVQIIDYCGNATIVGTVGPFTEDTNETIVVDLQQIEFFSVSGTVQNCDMNENVEGAYVLANSGNLNVFAVTDQNGFYTLEGVFCGNTSLDLVAIDYSSGLTASTEIPSIEADNYDVDFNLCDLSTNLVVTVGSTGFYGYSDCWIRVKPNETIIKGTNNNENSSGPIIGFEGNDTGTYPANIIGPDAILSDVSNFSIEISEFGDIGEYVIGSFSGTDIVTGEAISGSFVAVREE